MACGADDGNAFLDGIILENCYITAKTEFGELDGHKLITVEFLYGLWNGAARFDEHLSETMRIMRIFPSKEDADVRINYCCPHYE